MAWLRPRSLDEALAWLVQYQPKIVCGGTDLFVNAQRKQAELANTTWLDIQQLPELKGMLRTEEGLEIGAAVTAAELWQSPLLRELPALQQAARQVGGWQIQNRASIGGNLANASPAADMSVPLAAYGATVRLAGAGGARSLPISQLLLGPRKTAILPGEIIVSVHVPAKYLGVPQLFMRHDLRGGTDISIVSVAVAVRGDKQAIEWGNAAVGAAFPYPFTLPEQQVEWRGEPTARKIAQIAGKYAEFSRPITDVRASSDYRKALVDIYMQRALRKLLAIEPA